MQTADNDNLLAARKFLELHRVLQDAKATFYMKRRWKADDEQALLFALMRYLPDWRLYCSDSHLKALGGENVRQFFLKLLALECRTPTMPRPELPPDAFIRPHKMGFQFETATINLVFRTALLVIESRHYPFSTEKEMAGEVADALENLSRPAVKNILLHYATEDEFRYFWATCYPASGMDDEVTYLERMCFPLLMEQLHGPWTGKDFSVLCHHVEEMLGPPHRSMEGLMRKCVLSGQLEALREFFPDLMRGKRQGSARQPDAGETSDD